MAVLTVSGTANSFDRKNFVGPMYGLTPTLTPFLSRLGATSFGGGIVITSKHFPYQTWEQREPSQPAKKEAESPTYTEYQRAERFGVVQIFHEGVAESWTAQSVTSEIVAANSWAVLRSLGAGQPIDNDLTWQVAARIVDIARDFNFSALRGTFQDPANNATARKMRGLVPGTTTNAIDKYHSSDTATFDVAGGTVDDVWTATAHGLEAGDEIVFTSVGTGAEPYEANVPYFVTSTGLAANEFTLSKTKGGSVLEGTNVDSSGTWTFKQVTDLTTAHVRELIRKMRDAYTKNAKSAVFMDPVFLTGSSYIQQRLSDIYGVAPQSRTVGGVNITTLVEPIVGQPLTVVFDEMMEQNTLMLADFSFLQPVYLRIQRAGRARPQGVFFIENENDDTSADRMQLYMEAGLDIGPEEMHGKITGLATEPPN